MRCAQGPRKNGLVVVLVTYMFYHTLSTRSEGLLRDVIYGGNLFLVHAEYHCQQSILLNSLISLLTARPGRGDSPTRDSGGPSQPGQEPAALSRL